MQLKKLKKPLKIKKMPKDKTYCNNCGHECHCGEKCKQEYTDGDGERYEMQICGSCRHEKKNTKWQKIK